jgi:hypothetical protein
MTANGGKNLGTYSGTIKGGYITFKSDANTYQSANNDNKGFFQLV